MHISRRTLLIGAAASGGLLLGWAMMPRRYPAPLTAGEGEVAFDAWLRIGKDGVVTVAVPQLEMGQGVTTLLAQVVAVELGADWRQVAVEPARISPAYANTALAARWVEMWLPGMAPLGDEADDALTRRWAEANAFVATAEGSSLAAFEGPARAAAAAARAMLAQAAAFRWDVSWEACEAKDGFISQGADKRLPFGALVEEAALFDPPSPPVLRPEAAREKPGEVPEGAAPAFPRLDLPSKVDGSFVFAGDVRLPNMLFAAIRHGPLGDAELTGFEAEAAKGLPGVIRLVKHKRWLAALATDWWSAERALAAIAPRFTVKKPVESTAISAALDQAVMFGDGHRIAERGDPAKWLVKPYALALRYDAAPALHATPETASATARFAKGRLELWIASQAPGMARRAAAEALGIGEEQVVLYPMPAGGSFDRRLEHDHAIEAALLAREAGRPVQLMWSRWQEHVAGWPRPPVTAVMAARTAPGGEVIGWKARIAVPAAAQELGERLVNGKTAWAALDAQDRADAMAIEGAVPPYAVPHMVVEHVPVATGLPSGRLRGHAHGYTAFFTESFIDELATLARREPLAFRMAMLEGEPRLAQCLQRVSALADWNGGNDGSGQGIACHRIGLGERWGYIAAVATARRDETGVRVDRISAVADIGRIVNVDIARQQIEGGLIYGIGLALGSSTSYVQGLPVNGRLGALTLPLLGDCPAIEVEFVDSTADPVDPGELGVAVVAPAIANALFSATGLRFRSLPLLSEEL